MSPALTVCVARTTGRQPEGFLRGAANAGPAGDLTLPWPGCTLTGRYVQGGRGGVGHEDTRGKAQPGVLVPARMAAWPTNMTIRPGRRQPGTG
jgi:hypothetical protein